MKSAEQPATILIVDDISANLMLLREILTASGYHVRPASSGNMALRSAEAEAPDLILLDVRMPEMDGHEVCRRLKAQPATRSIPVIFISALDETADKVTGFEVGGVDYITKPFEPVEMLKRIETHLSLRRFQLCLEEMVLQRTADLLAEIEIRRQAEEAARNSEKRLADLLRMLPDPTYAVDLAGRVILWNRAAEEMTGIATERMLGECEDTYARALYGQQRPLLLNLLPAKGEEGTPLKPELVIESGVIKAEVSWQTPGQKDRYLLVTAAPLTDAKGEVIGAIESLHDISERKRQEEALCESQKRLAQIIDFLPDATFAVDLNGKVIIWNRAMELMTGVSAEEVVGQGDYAYSLPFYGKRRPVLIDLVFEDKDENREYSPLVRQGSAILGEVKNLLRGEERSLWGIAQPLLDRKGRVVGAIESIRDITERRQAEEDILRANELFTSVLRAATGYAIIGTDPQGMITLFNEGAEEMFGYDSREVIGSRRLEVFIDKEALVFRARQLGIQPGVEVLLAAARGGETETREWPCRSRNGEDLTVSLTVTVLHDAKGELSGFIAMARDVTGEKRLEQQFLQSQKMETVGLLAGGVAHDFNNLLTPILGYTDMLLADFPNDGVWRRRLQVIMETAERAKDLTRQLLVFSRKQLIEPTILNPGELVRRFEAILRRTIREDIEIRVEVDPDPGLVRADGGQLEQVLLNLAVNAQDAMPQGGILFVEIRNIDLDAGYCDRHPEVHPGRYVMLSVSDTGEGMDEKVKGDIFNPFFTTKEQGKGTGLGLSTVYGIVKQHQGSISVYSEKGRGSVFKVFLPRVGGELEAESLVRDIDQCPLSGGERVMVVEDSDSVRILACEMLEDLGYRVVSAESPEQSLEMLNARPDPVDLLFTDVILPKMNGRELFERLRALRPGLKVLYMSGYTSDVIGHHGVLDPGVFFLQKPFTKQLLAEKVRQAIEG